MDEKMYEARRIYRREGWDDWKVVTKRGDGIRWFKLQR